MGGDEIVMGNNNIGTTNMVIDLIVPSTLAEVLCLGVLFEVLY